jgi:hypothetical protein
LNFVTRLPWNRDICRFHRLIQPHRRAFVCLRPRAGHNRWRFSGASPKKATRRHIGPPSNLRVGIRRPQGPWTCSGGLGAGPPRKKAIRRPAPFLSFLSTKLYSASLVGLNKLVCSKMKKKIIYPSNQLHQRGEILVRDVNLLDCRIKGRDPSYFAVTCSPFIVGYLRDASKRLSVRTM